MKRLLQFVLISLIFLLNVLFAGRIPSNVILNKSYETANIKVHYTLRGTHATTVQNAENIGIDAQLAWNYLAARGFQMPPDDGLERAACR